MIFDNGSVKNKHKVTVDGINTKDFEKFLLVQKNLSESTVRKKVVYLII